MKQTTDYNQNASGNNADQSKVIPVVQEQLQVNKEVVETGRVRISKSVREEEVAVDIPVTHEEHDIQRVPVNQFVETPPPPVRYEGDTMIIPVLREEVVVQKRLVLVEELHITKRQVQTQVPHQVTLLREEVNIDRSDSAKDEIKIVRNDNE